MIFAFPQRKNRLVKVNLIFQKSLPIKYVDIKHFLDK